MRSFTLIEIVVVISIILILSVFTFPNFRDANAKFALDRAVYKLSQDLRSAEEISMSSQTTDPAIFGSAFFPAGGYGIYFQEASSSYILFADCDGDGQYDATSHPSKQSCSKATRDNPCAEEIKEISIESGIKIGTLSPKSDNSLAITFFPPDPTITINNSLATTASISLVFKTRTEKTVSINLSGLIEIQ